VAPAAELQNHHPLSTHRTTDAAEAIPQYRQDGVVAISAAGAVVVSKESDMLLDCLAQSIAQTGIDESTFASSNMCLAVMYATGCICTAD
jgi:hypothetical protein